MKLAIQGLSGAVAGVSAARKCDWPAATSTTNANQTFDRSFILTVPGYCSRVSIGLRQTKGQATTPGMTSVVGTWPAWDLSLSLKFMEGVVHHQHRVQQRVLHADAVDIHFIHAPAALVACVAQQIA